VYGAMGLLETLVSRPQPFWDGQEVRNELKVTCVTLKYRLLDFTQVVFWAGQEEENVFPEPGEHLKY